MSVRRRLVLGALLGLVAFEIGDYALHGRDGRLVQSFGAGMTGVALVMLLTLVVTGRDDFKRDR